MVQLFHMVDRDNNHSGRDAVSLERWPELSPADGVRLADEDYAALARPHRNLRKLRQLLEPEAVASGSLEPLIGRKPVFVTDHSALTNRRDLIGKPPPLCLSAHSAHILFSGALQAGGRGPDLASAWILTHLAAVRSDPGCLETLGPYVRNPGDTATMSVALPEGWKAYCAGLLVPAGEESSAPNEWRAWARYASLARSL